jgi:hypothetical protein
MLTELQDTASETLHDAFQSWRQENEDERFLTLETKTRANLHGVACQHLGDAAWTVDETGKHSLTNKRKVLGRGIGSLAAWAQERGVQVSLCKHCLRDELVDESDLKPSSSHTSLAIAHTLMTTEAMEGQLREAVSLRYGRNGALRSAALAQARGICEGCRVDFSVLFGGLGGSTLQVHHKEPVSGRSKPSITSINELAVLCANCHCIVHARGGSPMPIEELRALYSTASDA